MRRWDHTSSAAEGRRAQAYGQELEQLAIAAFAGVDLPQGWLRIRPATRAEDAAGVDVWVDTDEGAVAVQVKASRVRAESFRRRHAGQPIGVAVLHPAMTPERVRERLRMAVAEARRANVSR